MTYPDLNSRPAPDRFIRRWLVITGCIAALMHISAYFVPSQVIDEFPLVFAAVQPVQVILPDGHFGSGAALLNQRGVLQCALPAAHDQHLCSPEAAEIPVVTGVRGEFGRQPGRHRGAVGEQLDTGRDHHPAGADRGTVSEGEPESTRSRF